MTVLSTSKKAYSELDLGRRQREVLEYVKVYNSSTNGEIARGLGIGVNQVTGRIKELRDAGLIVSAGKRPCTITGRLCYAWSADKQGELFR